MKQKTSDTDYRCSHIRSETGRSYEFKSFAEGTSKNTLWRLEMEFLFDAVERLAVNKTRYLDFACGTGRIISALEDKFKQSVGVDVSESMLAVAREKRLKSKLIQGDITEDSAIIGSDFDLITAFRFFLNAQDSLRRRVIEILTEKLASDGIFIFNIHNSRPSFLWLQNNIMRLFGCRKIPSLSRSEVAELLEDCNLEIIETKAMCIIPKAAHIILRPKLWLWIDRTVGRSSLMQILGSDVIYVCRKAKRSEAVLQL